MTLSTMDSLPEQVAYLITKTVMSHYDDFKLVHEDAKYWTAKESLRHFSVPFHPGAVRYYKEIGAWTPYYEKIQKGLLEGH
jgi:TRAP-type uncharacterized transport system substrate-binding protein